MNKYRYFDNVPLAEVRSNLSEIVGRARHGGLCTVITSRGKPVAAVVPLCLLEPNDQQGGRTETSRETTDKETP